MAKIDFKTSDEKKEQLKEYASKNGVTVSYVVKSLVDDFISNGYTLPSKREKSTNLVHLLDNVRFIKDEELKQNFEELLEGLLCQL